MDRKEENAKKEHERREDEQDDCLNCEVKFVAGCRVLFRIFCQGFSPEWVFFEYVCRKTKKGNTFWIREVLPLLEMGTGEPNNLR